MLGTTGGARCARRALVCAVVGTCFALGLASAAQAQGRLITDNFSRNSLGDYELHAGGPVEINDGVLHVDAPGEPDEVITHNASGGLVDSEFTLKVNFKADAAGGTTGAIVKFKDASNYLRLATTYSSQSIKVTKWDGATRVELFEARNLFALSPNTSYWVRTRIQGNATAVELWGSDPQLGGAPIVSGGYTLTGADATKFGAGVAGRAGLYLDPEETAREFDDLRIAELVAPAGGGGGTATPPPVLPAPPAPAPAPASGPCAARAAGTAGGDQLTGTRGGDFITALAGNDVVRAVAGDDCVFGGPGYDRLYGAGGDDALRGGSGIGHLRGGSGNDQLAGRGRGDRAWGGSGADRISGGAGADVLHGDSGVDELIGGDGGDRVDGGGGRDLVQAGSGRDRVDVAGGGRDRVTCGSGRDVILADPGDRVSRNCERVILVR